MDCRLVLTVFTRDELRSRLRDFAADALVERSGAFFLVDPNWGRREREQWVAVAHEQARDWDGKRGWLCVPTGGSSGALKLARHDEDTLGAAVAGFTAHFGAKQVDALRLLPPWHVSGLMAWARCVGTGGRYRSVPWKAIERGDRPGVADRREFVSLVPTQLARLLATGGDAAAWLRGFRAVLVGGGPAWPELLRRAREEGVPVALCYGMTETAALVAAQTPDEFLAGDDSCGRALPHVRLHVDEDARIAVESPCLFSGYWPNERSGELGWRTDDLGTIDPHGRLRIMGRADALIISGGEKVNPAETEAALRAAGGEDLVDVAVLGVAHPEWGSEVVALYVGSEALEEKLRPGVATALAAAKRPRRYVRVSLAAWPRDSRGKVDRRVLAELATRAP